MSKVAKKHICPKCNGSGEIKCSECGDPEAKAMGLCGRCYMRIYQYNRRHGLEAFKTATKRSSTINK